jgi:glycerol-1-phosphate dehydrogenase [NAD(P)+]
MPIKIIQQLINGEYHTQGNFLHVPVKLVVIDNKLSAKANDLLKACGLSGRALIVSDVNTHHALAGKLQMALQGVVANSHKFAGNKELVLEAGVQADIANVKKIQSAAGGLDYIIAVGSGTINDLCKYASYLAAIPYVVFGTAPSMNGYGSANASITISGHKKTLPAHLPQGILLDLDVLANAPLRLIRSGLGDSLCRPTAQADWLLSHLLIGTTYTDIPFKIIKNFEADLFANSKALISGDIEIMRLLAATLVLSGFGMYLAGGSYPASQGEHMIAHTMEMAYGNIMPHSYHGEQIGITTLTMAKIQENIVNSSGFRVKEGIIPQAFAGFFSAQIEQECMAEYQVKQFTKEKMDEINHRLEIDLQRICLEISAVMLPYNLLQKTLDDAGCCMQPENIGWIQPDYQQAVDFAKFSRGRFTFLDLA